MMEWPWSKKSNSREGSKTEPASHPERYRGKPLLRLLELYVLWSIDQISNDDMSRLEAMAPKLTETFGGDGSWQNALATTMHMPATMPALIRELWDNNQQIASANAVELHPEQFAQMFVDNNLTGNHP